MRRTDDIGRSVRLIVTALLVGLAASCGGEDEAPGGTAPAVFVEGVDQVMVGVENFITSNGVRRARLNADTAFTFEQAGRLELRVVAMTFFGEIGDTLGVLTGQRAEYDLESGGVTVRGDVEVVLTSGERFEAPLLDYVPQANEIRADSGYVLHYPNGAVDRGEYVVLRSCDGGETVRPGEHYDPGGGGTAMTLSRHLRSFPLACLAIGVSAASAPAQSVNRCPLNIRRAGQRVERPDPGEEGTITAFLGGPVTVTCGDAVMTGDSAIWRQFNDQAVMIGNVRYRDTTRTLNSDRLTYVGARDEIVAVDNVRLVRISSGAMLDGPRVTFTRTPIAGSRTVATGRPRMTLPSGTDAAGIQQVTIVDADVAEFLGESEASATGKVEMERGDITATAERARFSETAGRAVLYEDAVISGEGFDLKGDSIAAEFELGELKTIHAFERSVASGDGFELSSDQIRGRLKGDQVEVIWAFGEGRSLASSSEFTLAGDSIEFVFLDGAADSVAAIGGAVAAQRADSVSVGTSELTEPVLGTDPGENWIAGDTVRAWFEPGETPPENPAGGPGPEPVNGKIRRLWATGDAKSFYAAVRDSARSRDPSRNYLLGSEIEIRFEAGEPVTLTGVNAIGVYLEPAKEGEGG